MLSHQLVEHTEVFLHVLQSQRNLKIALNQLSNYYPSVVAKASSVATASTASPGASAPQDLSVSHRDFRQSLDAMITQLRGL